MLRLGFIELAVRRGAFPDIYPNKPAQLSTQREIGQKGHGRTFSLGEYFD